MELVIGGYRLDSGSNTLVNNIVGMNCFFATCYKQVNNFSVLFLIKKNNKKKKSKVRLVLLFIY